MTASIGIFINCGRHIFYSFVNYLQGYCCIINIFILRIVLVLVWLKVLVYLLFVVHDYKIYYQKMSHWITMIIIYMVIATYDIQS